MSRCNTCVRRRPDWDGEGRCDANAPLDDRVLTLEQHGGEEPPPAWGRGAEAAAPAPGTGQGSVKRGRRAARAAAEQPKPDERPLIVAVHFRDVIPGLDMRGLGQRAYKPNEPSWRGYDVAVVPGFVVLTAPAKDGKRAVIRVPESMCIVVTEVAA
jgi:hypothetical protein